MSNSETDRMLDIREVSRMVLYSRSSIYQMMSEDRFPKRVQLGPRRVGWWLSEIQAWIADKTAGGVRNKMVI